MKTNFFYTIAHGGAGFFSRSRKTEWQGIYCVCVGNREFVYIYNRVILQRVAGLKSISISSSLKGG